jgi:hypothetical protein
MDDLDDSLKQQNFEGGTLLLSDFMNALQRLLRICVYYPTGHAILDKATDRFLNLLQTLAQRKHFIRFEDDGKSLLLEQVQVDEPQAFIKEFRRLLADLSIIAIEISRDIPKKDLHEFIRKLVAGRPKQTAAMRFSSVELTDIPSTIKITQREFLAREDTSTDGRLDSAAKNLNAFFATLAEYGLTDAQIDQCRMLLTALPERMKKLPFKTGELPTVSWDDIAALLAHTVQGKSLVQRSSSHGNLDMLASILSSLEEETDDKKSREAINILIDIVKKPLREQESKRKAEDAEASRGTEGGSLSPAGLQDFVDQNRLHSSRLRKIQDIPRENETLSVLMQLVQQRQSLGNQARIAQFFNDIVAPPLEEKTWDILSRGLLAIIRKGDQANLSSVLRLIAEALRRSPHTDPLELFTKILLLCRGEEARTLWPFAVNELLVSGGGSSSKIFSQLCSCLAHMPWKDMIKAYPVLQSLEAFQRGQVSVGVFSELNSSCYQLCAFLLKTPIAPQIQGSVIAGLRNGAGNELIKAVAPLLDASIPEHKAFLDKFLLQSTREGAGKGITVLAGDIIVKGLQALPQEMREQSWVPFTIKAVGDLQSGAGRELLKQIVTAKRLLLLSEWPEACRNAAKDALARMRRRPKRERKPF